MKSKFSTYNKVPTSADFAPKAIRRALMEYANSHWLFRYSIPLFLGSILFSILFGFSYTKFLISIALLGIAGLSWIFNYYFFADKFKRKYLDHLNQIIADYTQSKLKNLKEDLKKYNDYVAAKQLEQFIKKFELLVDILKTKFDPDSLTFGRYFGIVQEVYLSGIDNLADILVAHKTVQSIDINYIHDRLNKLGTANKDSMVVKKETEALRRSLDSHKEQELKIQNLMAENEMALSQIDETSIAISEISKSRDKQAEIDMENSMKALSEMKERSKYYSR